MARWPINAWMHVMAANCNQLGSYIDWQRCQIDCDQLGLCINEYIVGSFYGGLAGGLDGGLDGQFNAQFHLAVLGY